jgi:hypothetical protein
MSVIGRRLVIGWNGGGYQVKESRYGLDMKVFRPGDKCLGLIIVDSESFKVRGLENMPHFAQFVAVSCRFPRVLA